MNRKSANVVEFSQGETLAYNTTLAHLTRLIGAADATVSTTLPRGGLQITQPRQSDLGRMRQYVRQFHAFDIAGWQAMARNAPVRLSEILNGTGDTATKVGTTFRDQFLRPAGLEHYCAVPLANPVLQGYPGLLQLYGTADSGDFSDADLQQIAQVARELNDVYGFVHEKARFKQNRYPLAHHLDHRQFAFGRGGQMLFPAEGLEGMDEVLYRNLVDIVTTRLQEFSESGEADIEPTLNGELRPAAAGSNSDRLLVPDRLGDSWAFRLVIYPRYPAISQSLSEPAAFISHQPECEAWSSLRPSDFAADEEIARLVPSLQFMQESFQSKAVLHKIAKTVHLSPFHFHRRFTDLLGITPKHYLFDCQIAEAKRKLAQQEMDLKDVARHCGFAHQSHFTSRFKQATGLTPTKWRRLALEHASAQSPE